MEMNLESQVLVDMIRSLTLIPRVAGDITQRGSRLRKTSRRVKQRHQQEATGIALCDGSGSGYGKLLVCIGHGVKASF